MRLANTIKLTFIIIILLVFSGSSLASDLGFSTSGMRFNGRVSSLKEMRMRNIAPQSLDYSCGPAAIATILDYYFSEKITEKQIITYLLLTTDLKKVKQRKGFSLLDLKNFAKAIGYDAVGYKMDLFAMAKLNRPVLVPVNIREYQHFVIFRGLRRDRVFLADPVLGNLTMRVEKFLGIWKGGIAFILSKPGKENPKSGLLVSKKEEALLQDSSYVQRILGENALGRIFADGEF